MKTDPIQAEHKEAALILLLADLLGQFSPNVSYETIRARAQAIFEGMLEAGFMDS